MNIPAISPEFLSQLPRHRPALIVDADEVLLYFVDALARFLPEEGYELRMESFRLSGNIYHTASNAAANNERVGQLLERFFALRTRHIDPAPGAGESLARLSETWSIVVVTNIPAAHQAARAEHLRTHGMDFPVLANRGGKGFIVRAIADHVGAPTAFIDDLPNQHQSVKAYVPDSFCIHHVADPRMARLIGKAPDADIRADSWSDIETHLHQHLNGA